MSNHRQFLRSRSLTFTWVATDPNDLRDGTWREIWARCLSDLRAVFTVDHIFQFGRIFAVISPSRIFFSRWLMQVCKAHEIFLAQVQRVRMLTREVFHIREASVQSLKDSTRSSIASSQSSTHWYEFWENISGGKCQITWKSHQESCSRQNNTTLFFISRISAKHSFYQVPLKNKLCGNNLWEKSCRGPFYNYM